MQKSTLIYIFTLIALCVGSFWIGTKQRSTLEDAEATIRYDTVYIDAPTAPTEVQPTGEFEVLVIALEAELSQLRDSVSNIEPTIKYDTIAKEVFVYLPRQLYTFTDSLTYKAVISAATTPTMESMEIYQKTIYESKLYYSTWDVDLYYGGYAQTYGLGSALGVSARYRVFDRMHVRGFLQQSLSGHGLSGGIEAAFTIYRK